MDYKSFKYIEHYQKDAESFDYFEKKSGATEHDERRVREFILSQIDDINNLILDVGSGSSWAAKNLSVNNKIISLDISQLNIKKALCETNDKNHFGIVSDAYQLPFKDESFDYVIASEVIEHTIDPRLFLEKLFQKVKPGGTVLISAPYNEKIRYSLCIHCNKSTPVNAHLHSFNEEKLKQLADSILCEVKNFTFGNKVLIHLRTYTLLRYLSFKLWRVLDWFANKIYNAPLHILVKYKKR